MITDDLDLMQMARAGELLACVDDASYRRVSVVFAWPSNGVPEVYCASEDWPTTPAARMAERDKQIVELGEAFSLQANEALKQAQRAEAAERRIAELEQQLAALPLQESPSQNQTKMLHAQAAYLNGEISTPTELHDGRVPCDYPGCDARLKARGLLNHKRIAHGTKLAENAPREDAPNRTITQFVEELGWRCAAKGCTGAHARDLHDPAFCVKHAQRQITNGMEVAHNG